MLKRNGGLILTVAGAVLILAALSLFCYNRYEDREAGRVAETLLKDLKSEMETVVPSDASDTPATEQPAAAEEGYAYAGILSIPSLGLELPVLSEWDYARLKIAPCRQFGSAATDDLVIAAHNYKTHFGKLSALKTGAEVRFTDMEGREHLYTVQSTGTLNADAAEEVRNSGHALVLYTCTLDGTARVVVFCDRSLTVMDENCFIDAKSLDIRRSIMLLYYGEWK